MFSARLDWSLGPNRLARALEARRAAGAEIFDLTESNPTRAGIEYPAADVMRAFADPRALVYDPSPKGCLEARAAVSRYYAARGVSVDPGRIFLTASSSEAYGFLFKLLCDPGDEVLVPRPSYPLFEYLAGLESVRLRYYGLTYHGRWSLDPDSAAEAITPRTRALVVVNPNNPTGSFLKRGELEGLAHLARKHGFALVADEVFSDFAFAHDPSRVATMAAFDGAPAFALSGLSKVAGLPQMKLGWMVIAGPPDFQGAARDRLELIADSYLSVSTPVQFAAASLIEVGLEIRDRIAARTRANLARLRTVLDPAPAAKILDGEGGWYAIVRVPRTRSEEEWALELLQSDGVLVQPGFFYDFETEAFLVLSLLTKSDVFAEGARRLAARVASA